MRAHEPHYNPFILRDKPFVSPFFRIGFFHARVKSYNLILPLMCLYENIRSAAGTFHLFHLNRISGCAIDDFIKRPLTPHFQ